MLATLRKIIAANQDTLLNYTSQCSCYETILKFLCN
jgi:hypothetical protein